MELATVLFERAPCRDADRRDISASVLDLGRRAAPRRATRRRVSAADSIGSSSSATTCAGRVTAVVLAAGSPGATARSRGAHTAVSR